EAMTILPVGQAFAIQGRHLRIVGGESRGNGERSPAVPVAPGHPAVDFLAKLLKLPHVVSALPRVQVEPFVPAAAVEDALVRITAEHLLGNARRAVGVEAID